MALNSPTEDYFTYESRLNSFKIAHQLAKRRASNTSTKASKAVKWPHKFIRLEDLAQAGFYFRPRSDDPDNAVCFLCEKNMGGWEEGDDPLVEHLKHSPDCGWAVLAAIERGDPEFSQEYPASTRMVDARRATFADKWPHENKKGWKCKVKQLVEAGWRYTPIPESDDMATCAYCQLALDGWENSDKPLDEHRKRSSECLFFTLTDNHKQSATGKKTKKGRTSKASRVSNQSGLTVATEGPSGMDLAAEDDSILTTATTATASQGGRKMAKGKKAASTRSKKTKAKQNEAIEISQLPEPEGDDFGMPLVAKAITGRKRKTDDIVDSDIEMDVPPPKRHTTRTRGSLAVEDSVLDSHFNDTSVVSSKAQRAKPKGRPQKGKSTRSSRSASQALTASFTVPDDDEIDRALEADLDRRMTEDEEKGEIILTKKSTKSIKSIKSDYAMFSTEPREIDEVAIDAELKTMEMESQPLPKAKGKAKQTRKVSAKQQAVQRKAAQAAAEAEAEAHRIAEEEASQQLASELEHSVTMQHSPPIVQPKKPRGTTRKASKQMREKTTRATRASATSVDENNLSQHDASQDTIMTDTKDGYETDAIVASQSTVVKGGSSRRGSTLKKGKGGKKGASKNIEEIIQRPKGPSVEVQVEDTAEPTVEPAPTLQVPERSMSEDVFYTPVPEARPVVEESPSRAPKAVAPKRRGRPPKATAALTSAARTSTEFNKSFAPQSSSTPAQTKVLTPEPSRSATPPPPPTKDDTLSQSPQSSDAENKPPSSKPSAARPTTPHSSRTPLAVIISTPILSPSKRNVIAGLQSINPWTAVDLEGIFMKSPGGDENEHAGRGFNEAMEKVKNGGQALSKEEMGMTVEEWIHHNARSAEEKLRNECEFMVGCFEKEGVRAMRALEGIECAE